jgi:SAM-dependent methyltransferase
MDPSAGAPKPDDLFAAARLYDLSIDWEARIEREIPVLRDIMGPPGKHGLLDAGCGTGRQATALALVGYRMTGLDASPAMLEAAAAHAAEAGANVTWVHGFFESIADATPGPFDGIYCIGNSLATAGTAESVQCALRSFAQVLRPGGRVFVQVLNFDAMRRQPPCVLGPRVTHHDGVEYLSFRVFHLEAETAQVVSITAWKDQQWHQESAGGTLYPMGHAQLRTWFGQAGFEVDACYSDYARKPYNPGRQGDLIVVATRR